MCPIKQNLECDELLQRFTLPMDENSRQTKQRCRKNCWKFIFRPWEFSWKLVVKHVRLAVCFTCLVGWAGQGEGLKHGINLWAWECPTARRASEDKDVKQGSVLRSVELQYSSNDHGSEKRPCWTLNSSCRGPVFHVHDYSRKSNYHRVNLRYLCDFVEFRNFWYHIKALEWSWHRIWGSLSFLIDRFTFAMGLLRPLEEDGWRHDAWLSSPLIPGERTHIFGHGQGDCEHSTMSIPFNPFIARKYMTYLVCWLNFKQVFWKINHPQLTFMPKNLIWESPTIHNSMFCQTYCQLQGLLDWPITDEDPWIYGIFTYKNWLIFYGKFVGKYIPYLDSLWVTDEVPAWLATTSWLFWLSMFLLPA